MLLQDTSLYQPFLKILATRFSKILNCTILWILSVRTGMCWKKRGEITAGEWELRSLWKMYKASHSKRGSDRIDFSVHLFFSRASWFVTSTAKQPLKFGVNYELHLNFIRRNKSVFNIPGLWLMGVGASREITWNKKQPSVAELLKRALRRKKLCCCDR